MNQLTTMALAPLAGLILSVAVPAQEPPSTEEIMREDAAELTPYSPAGASARRDTHGSPCVASAPFELLACGPATTISLKLMPGIYGTLETTTTQGGQLAQIIDQLQAFGQATGPGTMQELARQEDAVDGSSITITIPLIDYGFQGSFSNAAISMNRANQREHWSYYQAVGPRDSVPGPGHAFPLSGKVTIEEYTPWVLRGSFSAGMVDLNQSDLSVDDPVLPVLYNLSGSFNVIGPWRGDERAKTIEPDDLNRILGEDLGSFLEVTGEVPVPASGGPRPSASAGASSSVSATAGAGCDCSCNFVTSASTACQSSCAGTFQACRGEPLPMISERQMAAGASLDDRVAEYTVELRKRFAKFLTRRWGDNPQFDRVREGYLESFDNSTSLDSRVSLTATVGMAVDCPPPKGVEERMKMSTFIYCRMAQKTEKN